MWPSNSKNINNLNSRPITIDQNKNNINDPGPIYQTPIKQTLNVQGNNDTPLQFDFNFYFGNLWSSGHIPPQNIEIPINNSVSQHNREANILLFKSSLEKSGYKLTPVSEIKNSNMIEYGITNNINNIYENELNQNEFTKKNLTELFNNAKNDEFLQSSKKGNIIQNNLIDNNNIYYYNNINNLGNNINIHNNNINPNIGFNNINYNNNVQNNMDYEDNEENKENKNKNIPYNEQNNINRNYENKIVLNNNTNFINNNLNNTNEKNDKNNLNEKGEEIIFSSPINKKPKKIFECSGSTLATNSSKSSARKKRFRKNNEQLVMLSQFFNEHKHWSKNQIKEISQRTGLKENKVYKWLWDQRNKEYKATKFIINKKNLP